MALAVAQRKSESAQQLSRLLGRGTISRSSCSHCGCRRCSGSRSSTGWQFERCLCKGSVGSRPVLRTQAVAHVQQAKLSGGNAFHMACQVAGSQCSLILPCVASAKRLQVYV